jgi:hypothetical protein
MKEQLIELRDRYQAHAEALQTEYNEIEDRTDGFPEDDDYDRYYGLEYAMGEVYDIIRDLDKVIAG